MPIYCRFPKFEFAKFEFAKFEFAKFEFAEFEFAKFEFAIFEVAKFEFAKSEARENRYSHAILIPWGVIERGKIDIPTLFLIPWGLQIEFGKLLLYTQLF